MEATVSRPQCVNSHQGCVPNVISCAAYWGCQNACKRAQFQVMYVRADSRFAPSQWETALLPHWLGASLKSALYTYMHIYGTPSKELYIASHWTEKYFTLWLNELWKHGAKYSAIWYTEIYFLYPLVPDKHIYIYIYIWQRTPLPYPHIEITFIKQPLV